MQFGESVSRGATVRMTAPYLDADRGLYTVIYVYRNGWLGLQSHRDGRRFDVPAHLCRPVSDNARNAD